MDSTYASADSFAWQQGLVSRIQADDVVVSPFRFVLPLGVDGLFSCLQNVGTLVYIELWFGVRALLATRVGFAHLYAPSEIAAEVGLGDLGAPSDGFR